MRSLFVVVSALLATAVACSSGSSVGGDADGGASGTSGTSGASGTSGSSGTSGASGASGTSGTSGTSGASGACRFGLPSCGGECVDLSEDARHCGGCGKACASGSVCVEGACRPGTCADVFRTQCGSACVSLDRDPDHCGACGKACPTGTLCLDKTCTPVVGSGESCADPLVMRESKQDEAFTLVGASADEAPLTCGDPQKRADRVFRWTAPRDHEFKVRVYGGTPADDLVVEVWKGACGAGAGGAKVACNNDESAVDKRPEVQVTDGKAGTTYFIVVSSLGPPPSGRFYLHVDD